MKFEIKKLKGLTFKGVNGYCEIKGGFGLYLENKGFVSFKEANTRNGIKTPYMNTKKVLQSILDQGGLVSLENIEFLKPINN